MKGDRGDWQKTLQASAAVAASLDPDELVHTVLSLSAEVAHAEDSSVILHDDETNELVIAAATGPHASEVEGLRFPEGAGIAGQVHATGRPRVIVDAQAESAHLQDIDRATHHVTRSMMAAPLVVGDHRLGVVEAMNRVDGGPFSDDDLDRFAIFANLIAVALRNARSFRLLHRENESLRRALDDRAGRFVAESPAMRRVVATADRAAEGKSTILLLGETGTGKELVARRIHRRSPRAARPFVALNCAALPDNLVESELFGHERGAFTGADRRAAGPLRAGRRRHAVPRRDRRAPARVAGQAAARAAGARVRPRRRHAAMRIDVRIVAATNRDLHDAVRQGSFREDLFYRLNVVPIQIPPLRERREDIEPARPATSRPVRPRGWARPPQADDRRRPPAWAPTTGRGTCASSRTSWSGWSSSVTPPRCRRRRSTGS